jgi:hypothetical protein
MQFQGTKAAYRFVCKTPCDPTESSTYLYISINWQKIKNKNSTEVYSAALTESFILTDVKRAQ